MQSCEEQRCDEDIKYPNARMPARPAQVSCGALNLATNFREQQIPAQTLVLYMKATNE